MTDEEIEETDQSSTSELPVRAWQITKQLSLFSLSFPQVLYVTGISLSFTPDSKVKLGIVIVLCDMSSANGFRDDEPAPSELTESSQKGRSKGRRSHLQCPVIASRYQDA